MGRRVTYHSRIPQIADRLEREAPDVVERVTDQVAAQAKATAPVFLVKAFLKRTVRTNGQGTSQEVLVGRSSKGKSGHGFYAAMVEYGTSRSPAQPFLTPAAEAHRGQLERELKDVIER